MRRATVLTISTLLLLPGAAVAKGGIQFDTYPDTAAVGEKIDFTVMAMKDPGDPQDPNSQPTAIAGRRPLVTFRSESGRVIRIRASRTDLNGIAYGTVAFPDKGPWSTELRVGGMHVPAYHSEPIRVGIGLTQTIPAADAGRPKPSPAPVSDGSGFPWVWVLSFGAVGSALVVLTMRRRGRWGAA